jgi:surface protein
MSYMFSGASSFNQNIGGWNTSLVEYMANMFYDAPLFDQDLGLWNVTSVTDLSGFIGPVPNALSTSNYNSLLIGWGSQNVQRNVIADFGSSMYTGTASPSRGTLTSVYEWMISDGGLE